MNEFSTKARRHGAIYALVLACAAPLSAPLSHPVVVTAPDAAGQARTATIDYASAVPLPLPSFRPSLSPEPFQAAISARPPSSSVLGEPGSVVLGARGNGRRTPAWLPVSMAPIGGGIGPQEYGTTAHPFSTVRNNSPRNTNVSYPSRASGRLFFTDGGSTYVCSGSLIKRGIVVTAAHCVANFGSRTYYSNWQFVPGYRNGEAPFGIWSAASVAVPPTYLDGSDACYSGAPGVVCQNDVALLTLSPQNGNYPGSATGWYGYG